WRGGWVSGIIAPMGKAAVRVVADPPLAGLQANARPDPKDLPNNHWSYAIQWFLFAAVALIIYAIALRKRWQER
ncbi:MAG: SURF1 family cytochrome oxidase biogenesis protein, partial [Pseudomonadota bacterium]